MSKILDEVLTANEQYTDDFDNGDLAMPPARRFAILRWQIYYPRWAVFIGRLS